jgi:hypothetical protein
MNNEVQNVNRASGAAIGLIIGAVVFAAATVVVKLALPVPAIDADRGAERAKDLAEIRATEQQSLTTLGWADQSRGIVRLPIADAVQLAAKEWQNPAQAMNDLKAREAKAVAPAPVAPAQPNAFE